MSTSIVYYVWFKIFLFEHYIQGLQAQRVLFDFQITGSKSITFHNLRAFFKSRPKHNFDDSMDFHVKSLVPMIYKFLKK